MKARMMLLVLGVMALTACGTSQAFGEQYVRHINGRQVIVHTNPAPVVVHRLLPPYLGKHVTERQVAQGRLPRGPRR